MYMFYIDGLLLPVTPGKLKLKIKNQNKTVTLINEGEVNMLRLPGLSEISFDAMLPRKQYPFSIGAASQTQVLGKLEALKAGKSAFQFICVRMSPSGQYMFDTNMTVSLEEYSAEDDAKEGLDIMVSIKLKQYRPYGTKTVQVVENAATVTQQRETSNAPAQQTHTVVAGDCLWNIAKQYLGDGRRYTEIAELNADKITSPNLIHPGQELILPAA